MVSWRHHKLDSTIYGFSGAKAAEPWTPKLQLQPELPSGMRRSPPAGIMLIQQPGRVAEVRPTSFPARRSKAMAVWSRKKRVDADADSVPQPRRARFFHVQSRGSPVRR